MRSTLGDLRRRDSLRLAARTRLAKGISLALLVTLSHGLYAQPCFAEESLDGEEAAARVAAVRDLVEGARFDFYEIQAVRETGLIWSIAIKRMTREKGKSFVDATYRIYRPGEGGPPLPTDWDSAAFWRSIDTHLAAEEAERVLYLWDGLRYTRFVRSRRQTASPAWHGIRANAGVSGTYDPDFLRGSYDLIGFSLSEAIRGKWGPGVPIEGGMMRVVASPRGTCRVLRFSASSDTLPSHCLILRAVSPEQVRETAVAGRTSSPPRPGARRPGFCGVCIAGGT